MKTGLKDYQKCALRQALVLAICACTGIGCRTHAEDAVTPPPAVEITETVEAPGQPGDATASKPVPPDEKAARFVNAFKVGKPPYKPGEELIYTIKWSGIAAGRSTMKVLEVAEPFNGHKVIKLDSKTESNAFVGAFYSVYDLSHSLVDAEQGFSRFYYLNKKEGRHQFIDQVEFDYEKGMAHYKRMEKGGEDPKEIPIYGYLTDGVSVVYYFRQVDLKYGDEIDVPMSTGKKNYVTKWKVSEKALIKLRGVGVLKALKIVPAEEIKDGPAISKGDSHMWLEEKTRIPLRVACELSFGSVTMVLVEVKNIDGLTALDRKGIKAAKKEGYE